MRTTRRLALAAALFAFSAAEAQAKTVYLHCNYPGAARKDIFYSLTIDYDAGTVVVSSDDNNGAPHADVNGVTAQPAQISDAAIVWKIVTRRVGGKNYTTHF